MSNKITITKEINQKFDKNKKYRSKMITNNITNTVKITISINISNSFCLASILTYSPLYFFTQKKQCKGKLPDGRFYSHRLHVLHQKSHHPYASVNSQVRRV